LNRCAAGDVYVPHHAAPTLRHRLQHGSGTAPARARRVPWRPDCLRTGLAEAGPTSRARAAVQAAGVPGPTSNTRLACMESARVEQ
jgi:hypothetical protein